MKRLFAIVPALCAALLFVTACGPKPLPERMDAFVATVEKDCANYTEEDWDAANEKFEALSKEYQDQKGSLTLDQIKQVRAAMGRYMSLAVKSGVNSISDTIEEIGNELPGLLQEIEEAVPSLLESIGGFFEGLFSDSLATEATPEPAK